MKKNKTARKIEKNVKEKIEEKKISSDNIGETFLIEEKEDAFLSNDIFSDEIILDEKNLVYHPEVVTQVLDTLVHPSRKYSTRFERELDRLLQKIL